MSSKRVTVIIATHNRMDIVHQLLFSLRMQTFKNFDLCIVDAMAMSYKAFPMP